MPGGDDGGTRRRRGGAQAGGAGRDRLAFGRRGGGAPRGALPPCLGRDVSRALRGLGRPRGARDGDRACVRRGQAARPPVARQELHVRDAGSAEGRDRALRVGARGRAAVGQPARALPGALRAGLDAVLRRRSRRRDRSTRGELARRPEARRGNDPERRRGAGLGPRRRLARVRRDRARPHAAARARCGRRRAHHAGRALPRLGKPDTRRARRRRHRGGRRLCTAGGAGRGAARPDASRRRRRTLARGGAAGARQAARGGTHGPRVGRSRSRDQSGSPGGVLPWTAGACAGGRGRAPRGDRRAA